MIPPVLAAEIAAKGKQTASKAITGDVYIRRWTTTRTTGKGKKKRTITTEHEAHVNPLSIAIGAAVTAVTVGGALWLTQMRAAPIKKEFKTDYTAKRTTIGKGGYTETRTEPYQEAGTIRVPYQLAIPVYTHTYDPILKRVVDSEGVRYETRYRDQPGLITKWRTIEVYHPPIGEVWTVKKGAYGYGIPSTAPTAQDAIYKAYPKLKGLGFTVAAPDAATRVYTFSEWKTRLEVKERAGFNPDIL